jgi:hypothetical protein
MCYLVRRLWAEIVPLSAQLLRYLLDGLQGEANNCWVSHSNNSSRGRSELTDNPVSRELGFSPERLHVRIADYSSKWKVTHWKSVNTTAFFRTDPGAATSEQVHSLLAVKGEVTETRLHGQLMARRKQYRKAEANALLRAAKLAFLLVHSTAMFQDDRSAHRT